MGKFYLTKRLLCFIVFLTVFFQINHKVKENSVNLIFAVTEEQFSVYNLLKENIEGSSAGTLTNDSSNIVQLVKEQYQVTD